MPLDRALRGRALMIWLGVILLLLAFAYYLGLRDGLHSRPPVHRGTYDSGEHDDRVDDYGDWHT